MDGGGISFSVMWSKLAKLFFWIWNGLGGLSLVFPLLISVGLYTGLALSLAGLCYLAVIAINSVFQAFNDWSGNVTSSISDVFSFLGSNNWFSLFSYVSSIDVPLSFISTVAEKYLGLAVASVVGLILSAIIIVVGIVGVIWLRRRLKYIVAGFGTSKS